MAGLRFYIILTFFLSYANGYAQHFNFRNYSSRDRLPGTKVYRVFEDRKGYVWYLTDKGISRFEGNRYRSFSFKEGFTEKGAYHIVESPDSTLWVISLNFKIFGFRNGQFFQVPSKLKFAWIDIGPNGEIFCLSRKFGIVYRLGEKGILTPVHSIGKDQVTNTLLCLPGNRFMIGSQAGVFLGTQHHNVQLLSEQTYDSKIIPRIFNCSGRIFIANSKGIYEFNDKNNTVWLVYKLDNNEAINMCGDQFSNGIWVCTRKGLIYFRDGTMEHGALFLNDHIISSIHPSVEQTYWISTMDAGVFRCNFNAVHIDHTEGLPDNCIDYVEKEHDNLYLFTSKDGVFQLNHRDKPEQVFSNSFANKTTDGIRYVASINDTVIYIEGTNRSCVLKDGNVTIMPRVTIPPCAPNWNHFFIRTDEGRGNITSIDTSNILVDSAYITRFYKLMNEKGIRLNYPCPVFIEGHTFYYLTSRGYIEVCWGKNKISVIENAMDGSISEIARAGNTLIIATYYNGLFLKREHATIHIGIVEGLGSDFCKKVEIKDNTLWVCTSKGISRIKLNKEGNVLSIANLTSNDYLIDDEVNDLAFYHDSVYVATCKGVSILPEEMRLQLNSPGIFIEKIQINNKDTILQQSYTLSYTQNNIMIQFNSPGYHSGDYALYRSIVDNGTGIDTIYSTENRLQLGSLSPGSYIIAVDARYAQRLWSIRPAVTSILIRPPFWRTTWFVVIIVLCGIALAGVFTFLYMRSLRRKNEFRRKVIEGELRSLRLHMNPHFIFNSLTSLQSFVLGGESEKANDFLSNFSKMIRKVMSYSRKGEISLEEEVILLKQYVALEQVRFKDQFEFTLTVDPEINPREIVIPSLLIQPFVENAIKHGLTGKATRGKLQVNFKMRGGELYCIVEDDGHGRKTTTHQNESGMLPTGVKFTRERIRLLIQDERRDPVLITDLFIDDKPAGTRVEILIPILKTD